MNTSRLEASTRFYRLFMKGNCNVYLFSSLRIALKSVQSFQVQKLDQKIVQEIVQKLATKMDQQFM